MPQFVRDLAIEPTTAPEKPEGSLPTKNNNW